MTDFITKEITDNILTIHINGPLDGISAPYLQVDEEVSSVILNCGKTAFMDSAGVASIVKLFKTLAQRNCKMSVSSLNGQPKSLFETLQIGDAIELID